MSVCKEYEARISALIDDELTNEERIEVLKHLDACPDCKAYWDDLLAMRNILRAQEVSVPAGFHDAVMARVRETKQDAAPERKILRFPQWKRFSALAACCAVVMLGIWSMDLMGVTENSMDKAALNGCAAPERAAQDKAMTGSVWDAGADDCSETPEVDYGASDNGASATYDAANTPDALPESDTAENSVKTFALNGGFTAAISTASEVAEKWVEDDLREVWSSGVIYTLSEEQYRDLRDLLTREGESFTEIMGDHTQGEYRLLAE
ncbi:MAG: zf-HC2 domain-containing protein [Oscillospiraceae bacterium]|nr:zf-HC2 domain-containing protein [Oscillospiraceae bacterium]